MQSIPLQNLLIITRKTYGKTDLLNLTTNHTPFLILGDINARVGELSEFTHTDEQNYDPHPSRVVKVTNPQTAMA